MNQSDEYNYRVDPNDLRAFANRDWVRRSAGSSNTGPTVATATEPRRRGMRPPYCWNTPAAWVPRG